MYLSSCPDELLVLVDLDLDADLDLDFDMDLDFDFDMDLDFGGRPQHMVFRGFFAVSLCLGIYII